MCYGLSRLFYDFSRLLKFAWLLFTTASRMPQDWEKSARLPIVLNMSNTSGVYADVPRSFKHYEEPPRLQRVSPRIYKNHADCSSCGQLGQESGQIEADSARFGQFVKNRGNIGSILIVAIRGKIGTVWPTGFSDHLAVYNVYANTKVPQSYRGHFAIRILCNGLDVVNISRGYGKHWIHVPYQGHDVPGSSRMYV
jgi:hypothetical protein